MSYMRVSAPVFRETCRPNIAGRKTTLTHKQLSCNKYLNGTFDLSTGTYRPSPAVTSL